MIYTLAAHYFQQFLRVNPKRKETESTIIMAVLPLDTITQLP